MGQCRGSYTLERLNHPKIQLKLLLIALRRLNGIPIADMAEQIGVPVTTLCEYEKSGLSVERYEAVYIRVLREYVPLACKENISFEYALKLFMNQKDLPYYNDSYKVYLFLSIMFGYPLTNRSVLNSEEAILKLPGEDEEYESIHLWNEAMYDEAFHLLATLRRMLNISTKETNMNVRSLKGCLFTLENGTKEYDKIRGISKMAEEYADYLSSVLRERGTDTDVYDALCKVVSRNATAKLGGVELIQEFLSELTH